MDKQHDIEQAAACRRLWAAVLSEAIAALKTWRNGGKHVLEGRKAETWLLHADTCGPGSFEWVCSVLDLDPVAVRDRLRRQYPARSANRAERLAEAE